MTAQVPTSGPIRVTVWGENIHDRNDERVRQVYPTGMHEAIAEALREQLGSRVKVRTATLDQPDHGLGAGVLEETDVLTWWGHVGHHLVANDVVAAAQQRVLEGMGLIVLHSGHWSKLFTRLMGTRCTLRWREGDDREVVWTVDPTHPIARGVRHGFVIPQQEMYGEFFDIPAPDELVFLSTFTGGEVFRSGCAFKRGKGRIFYFSPGHETYPVYHHPEVRRVLGNAVAWAHQPEPFALDTRTCPRSEPGWFEADE